MTQNVANLPVALPRVSSATVFELPLAGIARDYLATFSHRLGRTAQRKYSYLGDFGDRKTFFHEVVSKISEAVVNLVTHSYGLYCTSLPPQLYIFALFNCGLFQEVLFTFWFFFSYELAAAGPCYLPPTPFKTK